MELLPEEDNEDSRFMYKSIEALKKARLAGIPIFGSIDEDLSSSPEDEGSIRVSVASRLFLNG